MWLNNPPKLWEILLELVACPSFSGTENELVMARKIYALLAEIPYFRKNSAYLQLNPIEGDKLNRCFVTALLKGRGSNTVVLLHHHDIVGVEDYGVLKRDAFDPPKITAALCNFDLPEKARQDMDTGEWVFGRGIGDMKAGAALQIALLHDYSERTDFEGNILLLSVPGEESNSEGMLGAVPELNRLKQQHGLDYIAVVNTEPQDTNDNGTYNLYTGAIGKMLPLFYCFGKETHAGEPFKGLSSSLIFSQVEALMEDNLELCDQAVGEYSPPPVNLKNKDLRTLYNVTTPQVTVGYYNVFSMQRSAAETLAILKNIASTAFTNAIAIKNDNIRKYAQLTGGNMPPAPWQPNIYTYEKLYESARDAHGPEFEQHVETFIAGLCQQEPDEREFTIKLIDEVHNFCPDREPKIVIAFAPPYYPHLINYGRTDKDRYLEQTVAELRAYASREFGVEFFVNKMFSAISDLSYCGLRDSENIQKHLRPNMPAIGRVYNLPVDEMQKLDPAVINVGPLSRDFHKFTERLHKPFFETITPKLLKFTVDALLRFPRG